MRPFPVTAELDAAALADGLAAERIVEPARLQAAVAEYASGKGRPAGDAARFADFLVRKGLLTPFQARTAAAGDVERLCVGPYLLQEPLGGNDLGTVYRAVHRADRGRFAVRVVPLRNLWKSREARRHVTRLAALAPHPALVPLADVDTAGGVHYLVWPYADGEPLPRAVAREPLAAGFAARLFADLADGLAACHAVGTVHDRIRPSAILIGADRRPRLLDLGLGDILADSDDESMFDTMSTSNAAVGRIDFAPPEAVADPTVRSPAGDTYSLGAVLYWAVTGEPPFPDGSVVDKMVAHQTRLPLPVRMRNPRVPPAIAGVIGRMLAKEPGDRPPLTAVRDELRAEADAAPEAVPLSIPASALRDAVELSQSFMVRRRSLPPRDMEGAVDFDLPVPVAKTPKPARAAAAPPPAPHRPKFGPAFSPLPDTIPLPPAPVSPPKPAERPPVAQQPPPRRHAGLRRLVRSLAFWRGPADDVQLSVFGPPQVVPGQRVKFIAYAHLPDVSDKVVTLCRAMHNLVELLGVGHLSAPLTRGTAVDVHLTTASACVARAWASVTWTGQPQSRTFDVFVPWESPAGLADGALTADVGGRRAADIPVHFVVLPRGK
jgi:serine/threonine protein kinase